MPRMDGLAATRAFRAWERRERPPPARRLPIVALSANVFDEKIAECTAAGMQGAWRGIILHARTQPRRC
jgi:CheY-like chemotaxis protein